MDKENETILLTQQQVGDLFDVQKAAISKHVKNIFVAKELDRKSTVSILETVQIEGKRKITRKVECYNAIADKRRVKRSSSSISSGTVWLCFNMPWMIFLGTPIPICSR